MPGARDRCDDASMALVALVDDDADFLGLAERALVEMGVTVVATAQTAEAALRVVKESRPDVVLVDIGLPDRDGVEFGATLAAMPWKPRVVLTSSDDDALGADPIAGGGGLPFVPKHELTGDVMRRLLLGG
jgi:CheY-like chemotaxis protein